MNDRELLEAAAKAAGRKILQDPHGRFRDCTGAHHSAMNIFSFPLWNPLADDGDALRLAVKLNIGVMSAEYTGRTCAWLYCKSRDGEFFEPHGTDVYAATRRAITRAAAEIERSMK
jgi:hypothetical protein